MRTMVNQGLINAALLRYAPGTYEVSSMPQVRAGHIRGLINAALLRYAPGT